MESASKASVYYVCTIKTCPARGTLYTRYGDFYTQYQHNHPDRKDYIAQKRLRVQLSLMAKNNDVPVKILLNELDVPSENEQEYIDYIERRRKQVKHAAKMSKKADLDKAAPVREVKNFEVVSTEDGNFISVDGYTYRKYKIHQKGDDSMQYWRCMVRNCSARGKLTPSGSLILVNENHSHAKDLEKRKTWLECRRAAKDISRPMIEIFSEFNITNAQMKKTLNRIRASALRKEFLETSDRSKTKPNPPVEYVQPLSHLRQQSSTEIQQPSGFPEELTALKDQEVLISIPETCFDPLIQPSPLDSLMLSDPLAESLSAPMSSQLVEVYGIDELLRNMDD